MTSMLWWVGGYQDLAHGLSMDWEVDFPINPSSRVSYINQKGTRKKLLNLILLKNSVWNESGTNCILICMHQVSSIELQLAFPCQGKEK